MKIISLLLWAVIVTQQTFAQPSPLLSDTLRQDALNVYMDASDYFRKEIPYINYVRDLKDAGVYIIFTSQGTGAGGTEYTYFLAGQHE